MPRKVTSDLARGQACLYGGMLLCVAIRPSGLGANSGISYYGVHRETVVPYTVALVGSSLLTFRGLRAAAESESAPPRLRRSANSLAAAGVGIALTPYSLNSVFDWLHTMLGAALFTLQLVFALQLLRWIEGGLLSSLLLIGQFAAGVFSGFYVFSKDGFLMQGELAFQLAFGVLLIRTFTLATLPGTVPPDAVSERSA